MIAMIDIIPYKDLIVGDQWHVIRYKDQEDRRARNVEQGWKE